MPTHPIASVVVATLLQPATGASGTLALVQTVALVVAALATTGIFVILLRVALEMKGLEQDVRSLVRRARDRVDPVMERAGNTAENVDYVSRVVREDVERLAASVERLRERLNQASDRMEERIEEFNALMEVAQSEAEEIFLDTAATVRGVREGTRTIREGPGSRGADGDEGPGSRGADGDEGPGSRPTPPPPGPPRGETSGR